MYCCVCDLHKRHHPTPSCEGCTCFYMGDVMVNPAVAVRRFGEQLKKAFERMPKHDIVVIYDSEDEKRGPST